MTRWILAALGAFSLLACGDPRPGDLVDPEPTPVEPAPVSTVVAPIAAKAAPAPTPTLRTPASAWKSFTSESGAVTAVFPSEVESSFDDVKTPDGTRLDQIYMGGGGDAGFMLSYSDYPAGKLTAAGDVAVIRDAQAHFATKLKGSIEQGGKVEQGGTTWTESTLRVEGSKLQGLMRHTVIAGRLFQMAVLSEGAPPAADAAKFFASFEADPAEVLKQKTDSWKTVVFHEGIAQVDAPSDPKVTRAPLDDGAGTMIITSFSGGVGAAKVYLQAAYLADEIDVPDAADREARFDGGRDGLLKSMASTLVSERKLVQHGLHGREIIATATPPGAPGTVYLTARMFFHKKHLYQVQGLRLKDGNAADIVRFLDSFKPL